METTIYKTVKGTVLESLFNKCKLFSIRFYNTVKEIEEKNYFPERKYKFVITIRHPEETNADILFERALNFKTVCISDIDIKLLKKQKVELVRLQLYPEKYNLTKNQLDAITGITNLLDAIQDEAKK